MTPLFGGLLNSCYLAAGALNSFTGQGPSGLGNGLSSISRDQRSEHLFVNVFRDKVNGTIAKRGHKPFGKLPAQLGQGLLRIIAQVLGLGPRHRLGGLDGQERVGQAISNILTLVSFTILEDRILAGEDLIEGRIPVPYLNVSRRVNVRHL